jgi:lysophospholipase L1-like esterase
MARKYQGTAAAAATGLLSAWLIGAVAFGQDKPPAAAPGPAPLPAPFSRDCQALNASDINASPLPNVAKALAQRKTLRILAIGASATSGRRGRQGGYTEQIEQLLEKAVKGIDVVIINRGISGELAADAERRIKIEVALNDPDLVLWQVGTNDALSYIPVDELRATLLETIAWLKRHNVDVVLAGLQFVNRMQQDDHYKAVRELIRKVAADEKVMVVRRTEAMRLLTNAAGSGGGLFPEEFAQTEVGYSCLAEYVTQAITLGAFGKGLKDQPPRPAPAPAPGQPTSPAPSR